MLSVTTIGCSLRRATARPLNAPHAVPATIASRQRDSQARTRPREHHSEQHRREPEHRPDRYVDPAAADDQRQPDRKNRIGGVLLEVVEHARGIDEVRHSQGEVDEKPRAEDDDRQFL